MKFSLAALALAAAVHAQSIDDVPRCAIPCLDASIKSKTSCQPRDLACLCQPDNIDKVRADASGCVLAKCGAETGTAAFSPPRAAPHPPFLVFDRIDTLTPWSKLFRQGSRGRPEALQEMREQGQG